MTMPVPSASDSGSVRRGFFTSPAVNVMLFQASDENSEPVWATHTATNSPKAVTAVRPGTISTWPRGVQRSPKLAETAPAFHPATRPMTTSAASAPVFAVVKTFWTNLPYSSPRVLVHVRSAIRTQPTSCAVESDTA